MLSLKQLLIYVTACGLAFAAFRSPTTIVAAAAYSLALSAVVVNLIPTLIPRSKDRSYSLGFAVACAVYLYALNTSNHFGFISTSADMLLTQQLYYALEPHFVEHDRQLAGGMGRGGSAIIGEDFAEPRPGGFGIGGSGFGSALVGGGPRVVPAMKVYRTDDLLIVWHSFCALVLGECGGMLAFLVIRFGRSKAKS
jgi:hypothetical protein